MTQQQERTPLDEARRALMALRLEVPPLVADDVQRIMEAAFTSLQSDSSAALDAAYNRGYDDAREGEQRRSPWRQKGQEGG